MGNNTSWTQEDLDAVEKAIASGAKRVEYNDRVVVYKTTDELLKARRLIRRALGKVKKGNTLLCSASKGTC